MLSVRSEVSDKVTFLNSGADDYVTKPFSFSELLARINAILRRPPQLQKTVFIIGDLLLDGDRSVVKRGDCEIYLTKKEFELLRYLFQNQGKVLSRSLIMEHVWDIHADPLSNTIETHIMNLRRKVDGPYATKFIQTVSGRGYKIDLVDR